MPIKITNFEIAHKIECSKRNLMIIAPKESFKLQEKPKDPLLFYKINEEYFYLIHKWGNDLNVFRKFLGYLTNYLFCNAIILISSFIVGFFLNKLTVDLISSMFIPMILIVNIMYIICNFCKRFYQGDGICFKKPNEYNENFSD